MSQAPSLADILAVMSAVSVGETTARVPVTENPRPDDTPSRLGIALNLLLDDLSARARAAEQMASRLRTLTTAAHEFSQYALEPERLLETVARQLAQVIKDQCVVRLISEDGRSLVPAAICGVDAEAERQMKEIHGEPISLDDYPLAKRVHETGEPFLAPLLDMEASRTTTSPKVLDWGRRLGVHSVMILPLRNQGRSFGQLLLTRYRAESPPFDEHDLNLASALADHAAIAIANANAYATQKAARDAADRANSALRVARARFARLFESGLIGVVVHGLGSVPRVIEINEALLQTLGYSGEELISGSVSWLGLTPPEWKQADAQAGEELRSSRVMGLREKEFLHKDGHRVPVMVGSAMLEGDEKLSISFVIDLTERKATQAAIERLRRERASDAKFRALLETAPDAMVISDAADCIVLVNERVKGVFGFSPEELIGKPIADLLPRAAPGALEATGRRKDGTEFPVEVSVSPLQTDEGILISRAFRDITGRKDAERALARAKDAAEAANRELEAFSYSVAHDLRAPLRGMNGFAQLLMEDYRDKVDAEGQEWLQEILTNAQKMGELIDGLLSLARTSRGELTRHDVDLSTMAREAVNRLVAADPKRTVEVVIQENLRADVDPRLARALLENLLGNAWKFTGKVPAARIEFAASEGPGGWTFRVRDNGAGFDNAFTEKLFAPFHRLHTVAEFPGTGIGLATVQRIIHRHGGQIWAEGKVGGGAVFQFTLPRSTSRG